jgi:pSer/pThr/pTyr-binding forkhead associated (FHA) protein
MKKNRLSVMKKDEGYLVKYKLESNDVVDTKVFDMGVSDKYPQIITCDLMEENGDRFFTYNVNNKITILDYLKKDINKKQMLTLLYNVLEALEDFGKNMVSLSYVVKDIQYIFVNPDSLNVAFTIVSVDKGATDLNEVRDLIKAIISGARYFEMDKDNYVAKLITYANKQGTFMASDMKQYVDTMLSDMGIHIAEERMQVEKEKKATNKVSRIEVMKNNAMMNPSMPVGNPAPMPMGNPAPMPMGPNGRPVQNGPAPMPMGSPAPMPMGPNGRPVQNGPTPMPMGSPAPMPIGPNGKPVQNGPAPMPMGSPAPMPIGPNGKPVQNGPAPMPMGSPAPMPIGPNGKPVQNGPAPMPMGNPAPMPMGPNGRPVQNGPAPMPMGSPAPMPMGPNGKPVQNGPAPMPMGNPAPMPMGPNGRPVQNGPAPVPMGPEQKVPEQEPIAKAPEQKVPEKVPVTNAPEQKVPEKVSVTNAPEQAPAAKAPEIEAPANVVEEVKKEAAPVPYLLRLKNNEKIYIDKQEFTFGKSTTKVDYTISDNPAVSRLHCTIVRKNGVSFIEDNNSTNGTFVNGKDIANEKNVFLTNNAKVILGDEEFVYFVR